MIVACSLEAEGARAQASRTNHKPPTDQSAILLGDSLPDEHLFGDWGGVRTRLDEAGVSLSLGYTGEAASIVDGGLRRTTDYAHSINFLASFDGAKLVGWRGATLHTALIERAGRNASADGLGDAISAVQEIYGGGGDVGVHLAYAYLEQTLLGGRMDVQVGRVIVGQDFARSPLYCEFLSLSVCPNPRSLTIADGFTNFPTSTWGGRLRVALPVCDRCGGYVTVGAAQVRPQAGGRSGFDLSLSGSTGAILPLELGLEPMIGPDRLVGHYRIGGAYDTSRLADVAAPLPAGMPRMRRGQTLFYATADQMLLRTGPSGFDGLIVMGAVATSSSASATLSRAYLLGLRVDGFMPGRPRDAIGLAFTRMEVNDRLRAAQAVAMTADLPLPTGGLFPAPAGPQTNEESFEALYNVKLREGLRLIPDFQYVIRPDATSAIRNASVLALRLELNL